MLALVNPRAVALQAIELAPVGIGGGQGYLWLAERIAQALEGPLVGAARDVGLATGAQVHPTVGRATAWARANLLALLRDTAGRAGIVLGAGGQAILEGD